MAAEPVLQGWKRRDKIIHAAVINIDPIAAARCMLHAILPQTMHCEVILKNSKILVMRFWKLAALGAI